jgi:hypothetical protein
MYPYALPDIRRPYRRRKRLYRFEYRFMGPVAVYAEEILFFPIPHPCSLPMEPRLPLAEYSTVALPAEII